MFEIKRYTVIENLISFIFAMIISLCFIWAMVWVEFNRMEESWIYPEIEYVEIKHMEITVPIDNAEVPTKEIQVVKNTTHLNKRDGVFYGPSGKETYYNLPMRRVISIMREMGYTEDNYPYIEREDGVKCLGDYVIVAASLEKYRRGNIIPTSLGQGIVCDTGTFAETDPDQIDIAVNW